MAGRDMDPDRAVEQRLAREIIKLYEICEGLPDFLSNKKEIRRIIHLTDSLLTKLAKAPDAQKRLHLLHALKLAKQMMFTHVRNLGSTSSSASSRSRSSNSSAAIRTSGSRRYADLLGSGGSRGAVEADESDEEVEQRHYADGPGGGGSRDADGPGGGGSRDAYGPGGGGSRDADGPGGGGSRDAYGPVVCVLRPGERSWSFR
jgi:hypothetical protein